MSEWKSKFAVLQDLSEVTGGQVPLDIAASITTGKPVGQIANEDDIEDEYLSRLGICDAEELTHQNLSCLEDLLRMVNDVDFNDNEASSNQDILKITKLNIKAEPFIPKVDEKALRKIQRNVAIASILDQKENELNNANSVHSTYYDPLGISKSIEVRKESQNVPLGLSKVSMFKKKTPPSPKVESKIAVRPTLKNFTRDPNSVVVFKPKPPPTEPRTVWTKAVEVMRLIDEGAKINNAYVINNLENANLDALKRGLDAKALIDIGLPRHRHELDKQCVVCQTLKVSYNQDISSSACSLSTSTSTQDEDSLEK